MARSTVRSCRGSIVLMSIGDGIETFEHHLCYHMGNELRSISHLQFFSLVTMIKDKVIDVPCIRRQIASQFTSISLRYQKEGKYVCDLVDADEMRLLSGSHECRQRDSEHVKSS